MAWIEAHRTPLPWIKGRTPKWNPCKGTLEKSRIRGKEDETLVLRTWKNFSAFPLRFFFLPIDTPWIKRGEPS
jgi:hypothetical protein